MLYEWSEWNRQEYPYLYYRERVVYEQCRFLM